MNLKDRIYLADVFDKYIPDFTYEVIRPHDYTDEQLMEKNNEMGLIMLFNKLQSLEDFKGISVWEGQSAEYIEGISPAYTGYYRKIYDNFVKPAESSAGGDRGFRGPD